MTLERFSVSSASFSVTIAMVDIRNSYDKSTEPLLVTQDSTLIAVQKYGWNACIIQLQLGGH